MRKLLFLLLFSFACIAKAGNNPVDQYVYLGTDTEITDSATMHKLQLRKHSIVYVKGGVADTMKTIALGIDKTAEFMFKPELKKGDKITQIFKRLKTSGKPFSDATFEKFAAWEKYKAENPKGQIVAVVQIADNQSIVLNGTSKVVDIYRDGSFVQQLVAGGGMVVGKQADADSVNVVVASTDAKHAPTEVTVKFGEAAECGVSVLWLVVGFLLGVVIAVTVIYFAKRGIKRSGNAKNVGVKKVDSKDFRFVPGKNAYSKFESYAYKQGKGRDKKTIYLLQTVKFPDRRYIDKYVDEIVGKNYNGDKDIAKYIKQAVGDNADVKNVIDLPVKFSKVKPENAESDEWVNVKVGKDVVWVKFIASFVVPDVKTDAAGTAVSQTFDASQVQVDCEAELGSQANRLAVFVPTVPDGEVMPEKVEVGTAELSGVCDSLRQLGKTIGQQMALTRSACDEELKHINELRAQDVQAAVNRNDNEWNAKTKTMQKEHAEAVTKAAKLAADCKREKAAKDEALATIDDLNRTITRKDEESKEYNTLLVFYRSCMEYARLAVDMFDTVDAVENLATRLYNSYMESGKDRDSFCYYMTRVSRKFMLSTSKIKNLHEVYESELRMLAATGLVPKGGWIDRLLESQKKESMWTEQLKAKLYRDVFEQYCGYAVVMADEYAYMMSSMVADVDKAIEDEIAAKSEHLQELVVRLGYRLEYARPFTPVTQYDNVENTDFVDLGIAKDTIVEIKKMAVAYGTKSPKTEVSVQQ